MSGRLIFTFVSLADRFDENGAATYGMQRLHLAVHKHDIPITWIVSSGSAPFQKEMITEWHEIYQDEIALSLSKIPAEASRSVEAMKRHIESERDKVAEFFPWSKLNIAGSGHQSEIVLKALEELGFDGIWGFCWEQIEVDNITDRGCPWGFYYLDPDNRLAPSRKPRKLVGIEWTSRDLCKAHHSGNPCIYSSDPNDVIRAGLCSYSDIEYWKRFIDAYHSNVLYNQNDIYFIQQQESHEMECSPLCGTYTDEDGKEAAQVLDNFLTYVKTLPHVEFMNLSQAVENYKKENPNSVPGTFMYFEDIPLPPEKHNLDYFRGTPLGPWPDTFLFFDRDCQMIFIRGQFQPECLRNYVGGKPEDYFAETHIPPVQFISEKKTARTIELEFKIDSERAMPFGTCFWRDYRPYFLSEGVGILDYKIIRKELIFFRFDLKRGENFFRVKLSRK
ncbi:hypothetical protein DRQ15_02995 [candidate division KSB1 bacterium]|nr:MAG: hypothetical protein DRQ24_08975 [Candidatus Latescibacterota bacterium]RKY92192.1 MAG: hypothetical protein DRQ15_02995 [candidate division KSB1 bacterium]